MWHKGGWGSIDKQSECIIQLRPLSAHILKCLILLHCKNLNITKELVKTKYKNTLPNLNALVMLESETAQIILVV